ncbi:hypothetical protein LZ32DRAFT_402215 [Colletotrichum eremochloae]|nr:hypothetical protein LZ32DRAFT_402215 [Colletotrichum eremochloae]
MCTINTDLDSNSHAHLQMHHGCYDLNPGISLPDPETVGYGTYSTFKDIPYPNVLSGVGIDIDLTSHVESPEQTWNKSKDSLDTAVYETQLYGDDLGGSLGQDLIQTAPEPSIRYEVGVQISTSHEDAVEHPECQFSPDRRDGGVQGAFGYSSKITKSSVLPEPHQHQVGKSPTSCSGSHKCTTCSRACDNLRSLREHKRSHVKPHACGTAGCEKRFSSARDLQRHQKSIHEQTFSQCPICLKSFRGARPDNLRRHIMTQHRAGSST